MASGPARASVDLYWLPLGAGGHSVRLNGKVFEAVVARLERRHRCDLYHSALELQVPEGRFVIEQAPVWSEREERGVVAEGAVGVGALGRFPLFRYEVRRWQEGSIPDLGEAWWLRRYPDHGPPAGTPGAGGAWCRGLLA